LQKTIVMPVFSQLLAELTEQMAIHPSWGHLAINLIKQRNLENITAKLEPAKMVLYNEGGFQMSMGGEASTQDSVAVIPVKNLLTKDGSWWDYGTDELAQLLNEAYSNTSIKAVVLDMFTPGGSTHSVVPMKNMLKVRNKPVFAAVNSMSYSAGYYLAAFADKIIATDEMAQVGSIGVMAQINNFDKMYEDYGIKMHIITPPESNWKNKAYKDAKEGNYETLIVEELSPWAQHFQNTVKEHRKGLDLNTEGLLNGKTFYASEAKRNGLIDDIMPMPDIIKLAFDTAKRDNSFQNLFH